jgi:D-alanyl-D-alanine carboxypeptidase/D-alanyl-D-alanine-endopeptidase (penicillin-binding protein 4)
MLLGLSVKPIYALDNFFFWRNQGASTPSSHGLAELTRALNSIVNEETSAQVAVYVKSMKYGDELYKRNANRPLIPASTMKILTAEAALIFLGQDFRFATRLYTDSPTVDNGILQGNLYVVLSGDPTLTFFDLADMMQVLQAQQVYGVKGNVYIDSTAYDQSFYGPGWQYEDKSYCYAAPISAGIINHNCFAFKVTPAKKIGSPAQIVTYNKYFYPTIHNTVMTVNARKTKACALRLARDPNSSAINLDGCMPSGQLAWGVSYVVTDVPSYDQALITKLLQQFNIRVYGTVTFKKAPTHLTLVAEHTSRPLRLLINDMLKKSDNIIAGALFKKIGQIYNNSPGSWENSSIAVSQILARNARLNIAGLRILDGSGLSPSNLTTPAQMMQVLDYAYHSNDTSLAFIAALPIAGVDGTLKHRLTNIARKVRAKTGTISGVVSLAGFVVTADKEPLAFVVMINGDRGLGWRYRGLEDRIATALAQFHRVT